MGEFKDITDNIYDNLINVLQENGYEDITNNSELHNKIVELIDPKQEIDEEFNDLVSEAMQLINEYQMNTMIEWFKSEYEDPANHVPYDSQDGGYQYFNGGPYDPLEVLQEEFPNYSEQSINDAAKKLYDECTEWVKIDQY